METLMKYNNIIKLRYWPDYVREKAHFELPSIASSSALNGAKKASSISTVVVKIGL